MRLFTVRFQAWNLPSGEFKTKGAFQVLANSIPYALGVCVKADRLVNEMVCHGGAIATL